MQSCVLLQRLPENLEHDAAADPSKPASTAEHHLQVQTPNKQAFTAIIVLFCHCGIQRQDLASTAFLAVSAICCVRYEPLQMHLQGGNLYAESLQQVFQEHLSKECCKQGFIGSETEYCNAKAALEQCQCNISKWAAALNEAEEGSFSYALAEVSLAKAQAKLHVLKSRVTRAHACLQFVLDFKEAMLRELKC